MESDPLPTNWQIFDKLDKEVRELLTQCRLRPELVKDMETWQAIHFIKEHMARLLEKEANKLGLDTLSQL